MLPSVCGCAVGNYELKLWKAKFRCVEDVAFQDTFRSPECPEITSQGSMTTGMRLQLGQEGSPITCLPMVVPHYGLYQSCFWYTCNNNFRT
eukprot:symbB.v1.2.031899.t1/scaffold3752.1/size50888/2